MKQLRAIHTAIGFPEPETAESELDLVVPVTDPALTRAAIAAANVLGEGLRAHLRLLRVQVVPFPCDMDHPPVLPGFLREQLMAFESTLPIHREVRLARDAAGGLESALQPDSIVVLASRRRFWRTATQRLAGALERLGFQVVLVYEGM